MDASEWRTDEPEVGAVLKIKGGGLLSFYIYRGKGYEGLFIFESSISMQPFEVIPEWQPIATPEERRLKKRVRELVEGIRKHKSQFPDEPMIGDIELWKLIEKQEGEGDGN